MIKKLQTPFTPSGHKSTTPRVRQQLETFIGYICCEKSRRAHYDRNLESTDSTSRSRNTFRRFSPSAIAWSLFSCTLNKIIMDSTLCLYPDYTSADYQDTSWDQSIKFSRISFPPSDWFYTRTGIQFKDTALTPWAINHTPIKFRSIKNSSRDLPATQACYSHTSATVLSEFWALFTAIPSAPFTGPDR